MEESHNSAISGLQCKNYNPINISIIPQMGHNHPRTLCQSPVSRGSSVVVVLRRSELRGNGVFCTSFSGHECVPWEPSRGQMVRWMFFQQEFHSCAAGILYRRDEAGHRSSHHDGRLTRSSGFVTVAARFYDTAQLCPFVLNVSCLVLFCWVCLFV